MILTSVRQNDPEARRAEALSNLPLPVGDCCCQPPPLDVGSDCMYECVDFLHLRIKTSHRLYFVVIKIQADVDPSSSFNLQCYYLLYVSVGRELGVSGVCRNTKV